MLDFPSNPLVGQVFENWSWDGTKWTPISTQGGATFSISDTPPSNPQGNALWWDSVGGQLYVWYNDGNTTQWVPTTNLLGGLGEAPADGEIYARNGQAGAWVAALPAAGGRNLLHNGLFNIAQRGNPGWTAFGVYTLDRWVTSGASDTIGWSQAPVSDSERAQIGDEAAQNALQNIFTGSAAAGAYNEIQQRVEKVSRLSGKTVIVSFWAIASVALKIGVNAQQAFGTGGSPSAPVNVLATGLVANVTTTWARFSFAIPVPSIAGKNLGTNGDDSTFIRFGLSAGANANQYFGNIGVQSGTVKLWGVQLEIAAPGQTQPSPLQKIDPREDLANCQRFYQTGTAYLSSYQGPSMAFGYMQGFPNTMRVAPTIAWVTPGYSNASGIIAAQASPTGFIAYATSGVAGGANFNAAFTASADL